MHGINCQGCEFLRHEPPEGSVPGLLHLFRCMHPRAGVFRGHTVEAVGKKYYTQGMPVRPWPGFCRKEKDDE